MMRGTAARTCVAVTMAAGLTVTTAAAASSSVAQPAPAAEGVTGVVPPGVSYPAPGQPSGSDDDDASASVVEKDEGDLRVATLHAGITADPDADDPVDQLISSLSTGNHIPARAVAQTAQINDPDVLVLTGVSYDEDGAVAELLRTRYLASGQHGETSLDYPYVYAASTNSGRDSGADLDGDGVIGGPGDAVGYGEFPGQYGNLIFSKHPIVEDEVRSFQNFLWSDLPDNSMPEDEHSELEESVLRLPETNLLDVPVEVDGETVHVVTTSTAVQQTDDVAVARSNDLRRVIGDYVSGNAWYLYDDEGETGPLDAGTPFVVAGSPVITGESPEDLSPLLEAPGVQDPEPEAITEVSLEERPGPLEDTDETATHFVEQGGDLRTSYVLPSTGLDVSGSGVFWPGSGELGYEVVDPTSSYALLDRLVWVDLTLDD